MECLHTDTYNTWKWRIEKEKYDFFIVRKFRSEVYVVTIDFTKGRNESAIILYIYIVVVKRGHFLFKLR